MIFESDNTAVVHNMDSPELFPYKPAQMHKIFDAFAALLTQRAKSRRGTRGVSNPDDRPGRCAGAESRRLIRRPGTTSARRLGHRMLDDMIDYVADVRERPVWQPIPDAVRARFREPLPHAPADLGESMASSAS